MATWASRIIWPVRILTTNSTTVLATDGIVACPIASTTLTLPLSTNTPGMHLIVCGKSAKTIQTQGSDRIYSHNNQSGTTSVTTSGGHVVRLWNNGNGNWYLMASLL